MANKKYQTYAEKMEEALKQLPKPIVDKRHNIFIYLENDRARTNQTRVQHIIDARHDLCPRDILNIPRKIKKCIFKKDTERNDTYNVYIKRANNSDEYIKISLKIKEESPRRASIKTIFITKNIK